MMIVLAVVALVAFCPLVESQDDPSSYFGGAPTNQFYLDWLEQRSTYYGKHAFVASPRVQGNGIALHWTLEGDKIHLAVAGQAIGWLGFGLAEAGAMLGADILMYTVETNQLVDSHVLDQATTPIADECQDWQLTNSTTGSGFIIFEATRLVDTGDTQDRALIDDSDTNSMAATRVIAAWGDTLEPTYHGLDNFARGAIRFYASSAVTDDLAIFRDAMGAEAEGSFFMGASNFQIPSRKTTYRDFCFFEEDLLAMDVPLDQDLHIIGVEPVISSDSQKNVHHFILDGSMLSSRTCGGVLFGEMTYGWAPGEYPVLMHDDVGIPLGGSSGFKAFKLEIHYDNPEFETGVVDSSGVRMYYTTQKREHDMGVLQVGDPFVVSSGDQVSPGGGLAQHTFECNSNCLASYFPEPVTVIRENLHMHASGTAMVNEQIRDGQVIRSGRVQYYDFNQQGTFHVQQTSFTILPGDTFRTRCSYNARDNERFGSGSEDEMCIAFLSYYPRQLILGFAPLVCGLGVGGELPNCGATQSFTSDATEVLSARVFGTVPDTCSATANPKTGKVLRFWLLVLTIGAHLLV